MKVFSALMVCLMAFSFAFGQNEQAPIIEKNITYRDWTYKSIRTGADLNLRDLTAGKKLVIVVYYAPWCPNWRYDVPMLIRLYDKYKADGLEIVGVGEYDPLPSLKNNLDFLKIPFPAVYESIERSAKQKTLHYEYRRTTGDARNWGSTWYIFLETAKMEKSGDVLVKRTNVINGEMIEAEGEKFIREKLGLTPVNAKAVVEKSREIEVCEPDKKISKLIRP